MIVSLDFLMRHPDGIDGSWLYRRECSNALYVASGAALLANSHADKGVFAVLKPIDSSGNRVGLKPNPLKVGDFVVHKPTLTWGVVAVAQPGFADAKVLLFGPTSAQLVRVVVSDIERSDPIEIQRDAIRELRETINNATSAFASKY